MKASKIEKAQILEAYFEKSITKEEMETLLKGGLVIPPIPWFFDNEEAHIKETKKRELLSRVFGIGFEIIEWI